MGFTNFDRVHRVSYTNYDFMDQRPRRVRAFAKTRVEETVPPADRNIFDHPPNVDHSQDDGFDAHDFDVLKLSSLEWPQESNMFEAEELIRVPSLDSEIKWPRRPNRLMPVTPTMAHTSPAAQQIPMRPGAEASIQGAQLTILENLKRMTHQQVISDGKHEEWISESEITDFDVICERGGKSNRHVGTKRYRGMVEKYKPKYQSMTAKIEKTNLSREIIAKIHESNGRFLKRDEQTGQFYVLCKVETTKKVSQALREKKVLKWTEGKH